MPACDICEKEVEAGQPQYGARGRGDRTGPKFGWSRHYTCHIGKYGRPEPTPPPPPRRERKPVLKPKAPTKGPYNTSDNAMREFTVLARYPASGRTTVLIECPFCFDVFTAYVWSISGGGKKCPNCGAMHSSFGSAWPTEGNENLGGAPE